MKKIIMILTNGFDPDVRVYKEARYLVSKGNKVTILCWDRDLSRNHPENEILDGIRIVRFKIPSVYGSGKKQIYAYLKYVNKCRDYLKHHNCDFLHCNDIDGAVCGRLARKGKTPYVFDMHEFYENGNCVKRWFIRRVVLYILQGAKAGLYENSAYLEDKYKKIHKKIYPLRNYPDSNMIQYLPKTKSSEFRVGYHGVVRGQVKEFTALFEAVKGMNDVRVDINGGGMDLPELKELEKKYKNVFVNGPYNGIIESTRLYSNTDVLFCGYDASNPNYQGDAEVIKFYEAIFTGTPMIMTDGIGMAKKVIDNSFGVTCDTRNAQSIKKSIIKLKSDRNFWERCHKAELSKASSYSWEKAVKVLDNVYNL